VGRRRDDWDEPLDAPAQQHLGGSAPVAPRDPRDGVAPEVAAWSQGTVGLCAIAFWWHESRRALRYSYGLKRKIMIAALRYLDSFAKIDGRWYFAERKLLLDWSETRPSGPGT
jgi:hypothetical protein